MVKSKLPKSKLVQGTPERTAALARLRGLSRLLDSSFRIPLINYRIGLDPILGLIPGVGDAITLLPAGYIIFEAYRLGTPSGTLVRMLANVGLETLVGTVPLVGDIFDATFKANTRNLALLEHYLGPLADRPLAKPQRRGILWFLIGLLLLCAAGVVLTIWVGVWLFRQLLDFF